MRQNIHPSAHAPAREDQCRSCEADHGNDLHSSVREEEKENCNEGRDRNRRRENDEYMGLRVVGRGGMGTVLLGAAAAGNSIKHDAGVVAIKAILKKDGANPNGVHTEKEVLAMVRGHPFLPRLHAHFESERYAFLVMDYCSGGDLNALRQRQADRRLSETAIRFYAAELVLALEHLHGLGIVYRDLKPENVLISDTGHVVLTDFDLSLRLSSIHDEYTEQDTCSSCTTKHLNTMLAPPDDHQQAQDVVIGRTNPTMRRPNCLVSCFATGSVVAPEAEEEAAVEFHRRNSKLCRGINNVPTAAMISDQQLAGVEAVLRGEKNDIAGMRRRSCGIKACRLMAIRKCRHKERKIISAKLIIPWKESAEAAPAGRRRRRCRHFVGTEEYVAPEVIKGEQYSYAVDWWALGVLLYELMSGRTPFKGKDRKSTFDNILEQEVAMPGPESYCDPLRDLLKRLLVKDSMQRLAGAERVKEHAFFQGVQWEQLQHIARPPFLPQLSASGLLEGCPFVDVESLLRAADKASSSYSYF